MGDEVNKKQVQGTNERSVRSKLSTVLAGYADDLFLAEMVDKPVRRSPLIHRGYYIRHRTMRMVYESLMQQVYPRTGDLQIVSFGAGFDTAYFHYKSRGLLDSRVKFVELDFAAVVAQKRSLILASPKLSQLLESPVTHEACGGLTSGNFILRGVDLADLAALHRELSSAGVDTACHTVFLSECAITYMCEKDSSALISWCSRTFPHCAFATCGQLLPDNGAAFGRVMMRHFRRMHAPLRCLEQYPSVSHQTQRYQRLGFSCAECVCSGALYASLPVCERQRISQLEPFDEWEGWFMLTAHTGVLLAAQGDLIKWPSLLLQQQQNSSTLANTTRISPPLPQNERQFSVRPLGGAGVARFGHSQLGRFIVGGYGHPSSSSLSSSSTHRRLFHACLIQVTNESVVSIQTLCSNDNKNHSQNPPAPYDRGIQAHCHVALSSSHHLLLLGRQSPTRALSTALLVTCDTDAATCFCHVLHTQVPARWRAAAAMLTCNSVAGVCLVYGGRNADTVFNDCWMLSITTDANHDDKVLLKCNLLRQHCPLAARFSHSVCVWRRKMVVVGGLSSDEQVLDDVWTLDSDTLVWQQLRVAGLKARFSHTCHVIGDRLVVVGGVAGCTAGSTPGVAVIDLTTSVCREFAHPQQGEWVSCDVMLAGHSSVLSCGRRVGAVCQSVCSRCCVLIFGGGAFCFSFGTHINERVWSISLHSLDLASVR